MCMIMNIRQSTGLTSDHPGHDAELHEHTHNRKKK